jgi:hypothetical protein
VFGGNPRLAEIDGVNARSSLFNCRHFSSSTYVHIRPAPQSALGVSPGLSVSSDDYPCRYWPILFDALHQSFLAGGIFPGSHI